MATVVSAGSGDFSAGATWVGGTKPAPGDTAQVADGHTVTLDEDFTGILTAGGNTGYFAMSSGTITITGSVVYSGTSTSGLVRVSGGTLNIVGGGSGTTAVTQQTGAGYAIVTSSTGGVTVKNTGGTCLANSTSGRAISHVGTGGMVISGATSIQNTGGGPAISTTAGSGTQSVTGAVVNSGAIYAIIMLTGANDLTLTLTGTSNISNGQLVRQSSNAKTLTIDGMPFTTALGAVIHQSSGGTIVWTGSRTLADNEYINWGFVAGCTLNFSSLVLSCSGRMALAYSSGTITWGSGGTLAQITLATADAAFAVLGADPASGAIIPYSSAASGPPRRPNMTGGITV